MSLDLPVCVALFLLTIFGLGWPLAARLALSPPEQMLASAGSSVLGIFIFGWIVYLGGLPADAFWLLPILAAVGLFSHLGEFGTVARDPATRTLFALYLIVTLWCVGWLGTVSTYAGGGWSGDWFEHWERSRFFLERWPLDRTFLIIYPLPARPPLINVVTGAFLHLTRVDFAHYQLLSTLLAGLVFLPAAVLAQAFRRRQGAAIPRDSAGENRLLAVLAVLFMLNPLFVQNATFAWTKLPSAFFVLAALYFFLRAHAPQPPRSATPLCAAFLAAAFLAHFSAGPYLAALAVAWIALGWRRRRESAWWRETGLAVLVGGAVLATWFAWSLRTFGTGSTLLSNTSVTAIDATPGAQLWRVLLNLRDTLVPHFLRPLDTSLMAQRSPWGWWHDWFFQAYQLNLFLAFGSVAWLVILREGWRIGRKADPEARRFWTGVVVLIIFLGVATTGARDTWGLAHICLQPLVLLGIAFLAARWFELGRGWRLALVAGATVDFVLGITLHFTVQNFALDRWLTPARDVRDVVTSYNAVTVGNTFALAQNDLDTFSVRLNAPPVLIVTVLAAALALVVLRTRATARSR